MTFKDWPELADDRDEFEARVYFMRQALVHWGALVGYGDEIGKPDHHAKRQFNRMRFRLQQLGVEP